MLFLCAGITNAYPENIMLTDEIRKYPLEPSTAFYIDKNNSIDKLALLSGEYDDKFQLSKARHINLGYSSSAIWVKLDFKNKSNKRSTYILELNNPLMDHIELYYQKDFSWKTIKTGDEYPFSQRPINNKHFLFELDFPYDMDQTIYIKFKTSSSIQLPMILWEPTAYEEDNNRVQLIYGFIYGIICLMIINNLFMFYTMKLPSYFYYVISMVFTLLVISLLSGHAYEYLWPGVPWIQNNILPFLIASLGFWTALFGHKFLEIREYLPKLDRFIMVMIWVTLFIKLISFLLPMELAVYFTVLVTSIDVVLVVFAGLIISRKGLKAANYFVVAFSIYAGALFIYILRTYGLIPVNFFTTNSLHIGAALQITLLSLALIAKLKEYRLEKITAQNEALAIQKEVNENLEKNVEERTKELKEQAKELEESYKNVRVLSSIGQEITSTLNFEDIFSVLYGFVNEIMDASVFGVNIYHPDENKVEYKFLIEKNERLAGNFVSMDNEDNLSVWVVKNRKEIFINDIQTEYKKYVKSIKIIMGEAPLSVIYMPMIIGDRVLGTVTVQSFEKDSYNKQHLEIMRTLTTYTAIALDNAEIYSKLKDQSEELEKSYKNIGVLSRIGQEITSTLNFEDIFATLYDYVNQVMDASVFGVDIYHPDKNMVEYKLNIEKDEHLPVEFVPMDNENNLSVWTIRHKKEIFMNDIKKEYKKYVKEINILVGEAPQSLIYIPMILGDRVLGIVTVQSFEKNAYNNYHLEIIRTLASYTAIALDNTMAYTKLESTNTNIVNSIRYAKRIQESIIGDHNELKDLLSDGFVFYRPRDIVSGDFYWYTKKREKVVLAAVDCTGHGVPGAFMTMMGNDMLNQIIKESNIYDPKEILYQLDNKLKQTFHGGISMDKKVRDSMDLSVCSIDNDKKTITFAGAKLPLFYFQNGDLLEIKGSKFPIGSQQLKKAITFEQHTINYRKGDKFYIFSDGFQDQFGGKFGKKYMVKKFRNFITTIHDQDMDEQVKLIEKEHHEWKGTHNQTDDILIIGMEF